MEVVGIIIMQEEDARKNVNKKKTAGILNGAHSADTNIIALTPC